MDEKQMARKVRRAAKSVVGGERILSVLSKAEARKLMIQGAKEEVPSVTKISDYLISNLSDDDIDLHAMPVKQFIGMAVKSIMVEENYQIMETGVKIEGDALFRSGSTYEKVEVVEEEDDFLDRIITKFSHDELKKVIVLAKQELASRTWNVE